MSAGSQNPGDRLRSLRPWFLVAAMIFMWLAGVQGTMKGCHTVSVLREGSVPDESAVIEEARGEANVFDGIFAIQQAVELRAYAEAAKTILPISIARILLSLLLVAASAMVLAGRPGSRSFALQAIAANATFAIASYVLTQNVREAWISALARGATQLDVSEVDAARMKMWFLDLRTSATWYAVSRMMLAVELGMLAVAGAAVLSRRTRAFMDAVARAEERFEREDEP